MKIKYWSDVACPFCYIATHRMKNAMKKVGMDADELEFKSFQLDPTAPEQTSQTMLDHFTRGNKDAEPQARQRMAMIEKMAHDDGLPMDLASVVPTNSKDAHKIIQYLKKHYDRPTLNRVIDRFYRLYFVDGQSIADRDVLLKVMEELGFSREEIAPVLDSKEYNDTVDADVQQAVSLGIHGVPFFVINDKYAISGAQPADVFTNALKKIQAEEG